MKKIDLFFCLLLTFTYTKSEETYIFNLTELYDEFTIISKGMAETNEYRCSKTLINHKKTIFPVVKAALENYNNLNELEKILAAAAIPLMMIPNFVKDCSIAKIIDTLPKLVKAEGIKSMGQNLIDHANEIENIFNETTDFDGKLIANGKVIRNITGISFL